MYIPDAAIPAVVTVCVFTTIAFIFVGLRLCTRLSLVKNVGLDDYFIAGAMVSSSVMILIPIISLLPMEACYLLYTASFDLVYLSQFCSLKVGFLVGIDIISSHRHAP
jgi:hypothetical protein